MIKLGITSRVSLPLICMNVAVTLMLVEAIFDGLSGAESFMEGSCPFNMYTPLSASHGSKGFVKYSGIGVDLGVGSPGLSARNKTFD